MDWEKGFLDASDSFPQRRQAPLGWSRLEKERHYKYEFERESEGRVETRSSSVD
jgi:hypothetical protein